MRRSSWEAPRNVWSNSTSPFTLGLIIASAAVFLLSFAGLSLDQWLMYMAPQQIVQPWRLLTYTIVPQGIIGLLFYCLGLWWVGSSLERSWGTPFYAAFWAAMSLITAIGMTIGGFIFGVNFPMTYWLPLTAIIFAWCLINPEQEIHIYGIIPVKAKWLGIGELLIIFFTHAYIHPLMGLFALSGCGAAYAWVRSRAWGGVNLYSSIPIWRWGSGEKKKAKPKLTLVPPRAPKPKDDRFTIRDLNPFEMMARRKRRKQFEKLMGDD